MGQSGGVQPSARTVAVAMPPSWLMDRCQRLTPLASATASTVPLTWMVGPLWSSPIQQSCQFMPAGAPSTLATASLAANRAARERVFSSRSAGTNSRSRSPGVRSSWRPKRSMSTTSTPMPMIMGLLYGDALGQVARLVHVVALGAGQFSSKNLQRNRGEQRHQQCGRLRDVEHVLRVILDRLVAFLGDHQGAGPACADFLDVADHLGVQGVPPARGGHHNEDRLAVVDQGDRTVLELAGSEAFSVDVRDFLELQSTLEGYRVTHVTAQEQHGLLVLHAARELTQGASVVQDLLDLGRDLAQVREDVLDLAGEDVPAQLRKVQAQQVRGGDLGQERLSGGHCDFRTGVRVQHGVGLTR